MCDYCLPQPPQPPLMATTNRQMTIWPSRCRSDCRCVTCRPDILRLDTAGASYAPTHIVWINTAGAAAAC